MTSTMMLVLLGVASFSAIEATQANPIRRVVTLMQDMQHEIEAEAEKEKGLYEKFMCFCNSSDGELSAGGEKAKGQIEELTAKVEQESAEKAQLTQELKDHKQDRANAEQDLAKAQAIREKEHNDYLAEVGDQKANLDSITAAIAALERGGSGFLQMRGSMGKFRRVIEGTELLARTTGTV